MYCDLSRTTGSRPIPREVRPSCPKVPREPCALWPRWPSSTLTIGVLYLWLTTSLISGTKTGRARDKTESSKLRATASCAPRRQRPVLGPLSLCPLTVAVVALAMTGPRPPCPATFLGLSRQDSSDRHLKSAVALYLAVGISTLLWVPRGGRASHSPGPSQLLSRALEESQQGRQ